MLTRFVALYEVSHILAEVSFITNVFIRQNIADAAIAKSYLVLGILKAVAVLSGVHECVTL